MNKMLAGDFQILAESPDRANVYTGSPCLAQLPSGRLIASYEWFRQQPYVEKIPDQLDILVSDDGGSRWRKTAALDIIWPSLFAVDETLYCIGNRRLRPRDYHCPLHRWRRDMERAVPTLWRTPSQCAHQRAFPAWLCLSHL